MTHPHYSKLRKSMLTTEIHTTIIIIVIVEMANQDRITAKIRVDFIHF